MPISRGSSTQRPCSDSPGHLYQKGSQAAITESEHLGAVLAHIQELQAAAPPKPARRVPIGKQATQHRPTGRRNGKRFAGPLRGAT